MRFQRSEDSWIVYVKRREFPIARSSWPAEFVIGTINERTHEIDVWHPSDSAIPGRNREELRKAWDRAARDILYATQNGKEFAHARQEYRKEEERTGSFVVQLSDGRESAFHEMKRGAAWAEKELSTMPAGSLAEFRRTHPSKGRQQLGETFHALEVNQYGRITMANLRRKTAGSADSRRSADHEPPHPSCGFGKEKTREEIETRIQWESWAAQKARRDGHESMAVAHERARTSYLRLLHEKGSSAAFGDHQSTKPYIVFRRAAGVLIPVGRYASLPNAKKRAKLERLIVKHIADIKDESTRRMLRLHV